MHAHLAVSQVVIKRTNLYQPKEGTEQYSFAHVWLYVTAAHDNILEDIATLTIQGKNLRAAWYPHRVGAKHVMKATVDAPRKPGQEPRVGWELAKTHRAQNPEDQG